MNRNMPNSAMRARPMVRKAPARLRSRTMCSGSSGWRARLCHQAKATSSSAPPTSTVSTRASLQPRGCASLHP